MFADRVQPQIISTLTRLSQNQWIDLMLDSAGMAARPFCVEIQQNLDNCIGESGKTKHLIEASSKELVILFLRAETF